MPGITSSHSCLPPSENNSEGVYDSICRCQILHWQQYYICLDSKSFLQFKLFVSVQIGEIQNNLDPSRRKHIPSEKNLTDDVSRGLHVKQLMGRWMNSPEFLTLPEEQWPVQTATLQQEGDMERRHINVVSAVSPADVGNVTDVKNSSSWWKLIRVTV